jgi:polyphosphate kinase
MRNFEIDPTLVFRTGRPVNLNRLTSLYDLIPLPRLKYPPYQAAPTPGFETPEDIFTTLRGRDVLLHHPFQGFDPVVQFISTAANDPQVLAVKATLYRTNATSPVMYALMEAAQRGKEVVAVVELKARFDEQSNIQWARQLEERGGTVVYGLVGLKTHCKLALVLRKEEGGFRRYTHIGTGNYNPDTARQYTDLSYLTSDRKPTPKASSQPRAR